MVQRISKIVCYMSMICCMFASNALDKITNLDENKTKNPEQSPTADKKNHDDKKNPDKKSEQKNGDTPAIKDIKNKNENLQNKQDNKDKKMNEATEKGSVADDASVTNEHENQNESKVEIIPVLVVEDDEHTESLQSAKNIAVTNKSGGVAGAKTKTLTKANAKKISTDMLSSAKNGAINTKQSVMNFLQQKYENFSASLEYAKSSTKDMTGWAKISGFAKAFWSDLQK